MSEKSPPLHVVLYEPEIPPNTGNLIRLCANTGVRLHLIEPLGFSMNEKALRRAGLDYHDKVTVLTHASIEHCLSTLAVSGSTRKVFALSTRGTGSYANTEYRQGDVLLFGPETRGLPQSLLDDDRIHQTIRIPMQNNSRSLNLSNAVAIVTFEALRQLGFPDLE